MMKLPEYSRDLEYRWSKYFNNPKNFGVVSDRNTKPYDRPVCDSMSDASCNSCPYSVNGHCGFHSIPEYYEDRTKVYRTEYDRIRKLNAGARLDLI